MSQRIKPLKDIRYFESAVVPGLGKPLPSTGTGLLGIPVTAHRIGQRVACLLESAGFSVGKYTHVYVAFTPSIREGQIVATDFGLESWQRYVACGVPSNFKLLAEGAKLQLIQSATFEILGTLRPDNISLLDGIRERLDRDGTRTRVLRATKETKAYRFEVWFDVPPWRETSYLYVTARDNGSGEILEAPPLPLEDFEDAFPLVSTISFTKGILRLNPRKSFRAGMSTQRYRTPIQIAFSAFVSRKNASAVGSRSEPRL